MPSTDKTIAPTRSGVTSVKDKSSSNTSQPNLSTRSSDKKQKTKNEYGSTSKGTEPASSHVKGKSTANVLPLNVSLHKLSTSQLQSHGKGESENKKQSESTNESTSTRITHNKHLLPECSAKDSPGVNSNGSVVPESTGDESHLHLASLPPCSTNRSSN